MSSHSPSGIAPWVNHEVDMVRHQTVGIEAAVQLLFPFPQILKVILVIVVVGKNDLASMPALDYMMRNMGENDTSWTRQGRQD
jgi:hypothetical protein